MTNIFLITFLFLTGCALFRWRAPILGALRRFDEANRARREDELRARLDPKEHYRQTLRVAAEEVEEVAEILEPDPRTGMRLPAFVFLGVRYASREEANAARNATIVTRAREFYIALDGRRLEGHSRPGETPRPALTEPREKIEEPRD